jgi:hypothetical protein
MEWTLQGSNPGRVKRFFSFPRHPDWFWVLPGLLFSGYWCSFVGLNWPGYEVNHTLQSCAEVKDEWSYPSFHLYAFMMCSGTTLNFI